MLVMSVVIAVSACLLAAVPWIVDFRVMIAVQLVVGFFFSGVNVCKL